MTLENRMNDFAFEIVSEPEEEEVSFLDRLADSTIKANEILKELEGR